MPGREQSNLDVLMFCGLGMVQVARTSARVASLALLGRPLVDAARVSSAVPLAQLRATRCRKGVARRLQCGNLVASVAPPVAPKASSRPSGRRVRNVPVPMAEENTEHSNHQGSETVIAGSDGLENNALKRTRSPGCAWSALAA
jgi:hypothetical protein